MPPESSFDHLRLIMPEPPETDPEDPGPVDNGAPSPARAPESLPQADLLESSRFTILGHDRGRFYFSGMGGQVRDFSPRELHSLSGLCELAPLPFWESEFRARGKAGGCNTAAAGAALMQASFGVGVFDSARLRGRGAWIDDGRVVLHAGDELLVDGAPSPLRVPRSRFIYEHSVRLPMPIAEPLSSAEAGQLLELCRMPTWEAPNHMGRLLAGWCVVAPVCGAMPWRPHLWVSGERACGKTWVMEQIVSPVVGAIALHVQSVTTEAGIRQDLGSDARPVIFDEAETQTEADRARIQSVLNLARQASAEGGAAIVKGSATGKAMHYRIRSMFSFSSINQGVTQAADESRTVQLVLQADRKPGHDERFGAMRKLRDKLITPDFSARLLARTLALLPVIRQNADLFAGAIARAGHGRRTGDTIGVLLAGAWSLRSNRVVSPEGADKFVAETEWLQQAVTQADSQPEWQRALAHMLQHRLRVNRERGTDDVPLAELIEIAAGKGPTDGLSPKDAEKALVRIGLRVVQGGRPTERFDALAIWNNSTEIAAAFSKSPWAAAWLSTLGRAPNAKPSPNPIRFGPNGPQRCLVIPLAEILPSDE